MHLSDYGLRFDSWGDKFSSNKRLRDVFNEALMTYEANKDGDSYTVYVASVYKHGLHQGPIYLADDLIALIGKVGMSWSIETSIDKVVYDLRRNL